MGQDDLIIDYVYPPLVALLTVPWTLLPVGLAEVLFQFLLIAVFVATLVLLGVRDWRCYGLAFLWPPVTDAVATGNISILLGFAAAVVWVYRDRARVAGAALGVSIAAKVFLWPLAVWLAVTGRVRAAAWSVGVAVVTVLASWAVVGFRGFAKYPDLVRRLTDRMDERSYSVYALGVDVGLPGGSCLGAVARDRGRRARGRVSSLARRGDEQRAFVLALAAAIAFSPIVWLHYFALLLVAVAIAQPRLAPIWFIGIPLQVVVDTGVYNGSTFQTAAVLIRRGRDHCARACSGVVAVRARGGLRALAGDDRDLVVFVDHARTGLLQEVRRLRLAPGLVDDHDSVAVGERLPARAVLEVVVLKLGRRTRGRRARSARRTRRDPGARGSCTASSPRSDPERIRDRQAEAHRARPRPAHAASTPRTRRRRA